MRKPNASKTKWRTSVEATSGSDELASTDDGLPNTKSYVRLLSPVDPQLLPSKRDKIIKAALSDGIVNKRKRTKLKTIQFKYPVSKRRTRRRSGIDDGSLAESSKAGFMDPFSGSKLKTTTASQEMSQRQKKESFKTEQNVQHSASSEPKTSKMAPKLKELGSVKTAFKKNCSPSSSQRSLVSWLDKTPPPPKPLVRDYSKRRRENSSIGYSRAAKTNLKPKVAKSRISSFRSKYRELEEKGTSTSEETSLWQRKLDVVPSKYIKQVCIPSIPELSTMSPSSVNSALTETRRRQYSSSSNQKAQQKQQPPDKVSEAKIIPNVCVESYQPGLLTTNSAMHLTSTEKMFSENSSDERSIIFIPLLVDDEASACASQVEIPKNNSTLPKVTEQTSNTHHHTLQVNCLSTPEQMEIATDNTVQQNEQIDVTTYEEKMDTDESDVDSAVGSGEEGQFSRLETSEFQPFNNTMKCSKAASHCSTQKVEPNVFYMGNAKCSETSYSQNRLHDAEHPPSKEINNSNANSKNCLKTRPDCTPDSQVLLQTIIQDLKQLSDNYSRLLFNQTSASQTHDLLSRSASSTQKNIASSQRFSCIQSSPTNSLNSDQILSQLSDENTINQSATLASLRQSCFRELESTAELCAEFSKQLPQVCSRLKVITCKQVTAWNNIFMELKQISVKSNKLLQATNHLIHFISKQ